MMTKESILQEIIEVATEALSSTNSISDDLNLLVKFLYKKEVQLKETKLIERILEEESNYTPPKEDVRKLYVKRVPKTGLTTKDNELIEIGYYRCVSTKDYFIPSWSLHTLAKLPDTDSSFIFEVFTKESYYPGWLGEDENGKLKEVPILNSLKEIYVNCNEVVGFSNIALDWSWYYQDFVDIDKNYY